MLPEAIPALGYPLATVMGIIMGLLGAGGGILTVPILVYTLAVPAVQATAYSLFVVGIGAGVAAWRQHQQKMVDLRTGVLFAVPSLIGVLIARLFIVPFLPEVVFDVGVLTLTRDMVLLSTFALLMLGAAYFMLFPVPEQKKKWFFFPKHLNLAAKQMVVLEGLGVGVITGMVGAGGGFIIVPVLLLMTGLSMRKAVGTSLFIIAVKSLFGFSGDLLVGTPMDWPLLAGFTVATLVGVLAAEGLQHKIKAEYLKQGFGYFVAGMGIFILGKQLVLFFQ